MRLIDADALLEKMKKTDRYFNIVFDIEEAPTIDIPQGEWIDKGSWMGFECSRCKCHSQYVTPFCPQCGARMDGEKQ